MVLKLLASRVQDPLWFPLGINAPFFQSSFVVLCGRLRGRTRRYRGTSSDHAGRPGRFGELAGACKPSPCPPIYESFSCDSAHFLLSGKKLMPGRLLESSVTRAHGLSKCLTPQSLAVGPNRGIIIYLKLTGHLFHHEMGHLYLITEFYSWVAR